MYEDIDIKVPDIILEVGSGSGTSNYNELFNKPAINGNVLENDKTPEELGLISAEGLAELLLVSDFASKTEVQQALLPYLLRSFNYEETINPNSYILEWMQMVQSPTSVIVQAAIINVQTGVQQVLNIPIPFADETKPGIVTKEDIIGIRQSATDIAILQTNINIINGLLTSQRTDIDKNTSDIVTLTETVNTQSDDFSLLQTTVLGNTQAIQDNGNSISSINEKIPSIASNINKLTTKNYVDNAVATFSAHYLTSDANGSAFATKAELDGATTFYYGGDEFTPTPNDHVWVLNDETQDNLSTRYVYVNGQWELYFVDKVGSFVVTQEQLDAMNSGITDSLVEQIPITANDLIEHIEDTNNPHNVTAQQVGLGTAAGDITTLQTAVSNANQALSALQTALDTANSSIQTLQDNQIVSAEENGKIYQEADKTLSVYGWDALNAEVDDLENNKQNTLAFPLSVAQGGTGVNNTTDFVNNTFPYSPIGFGRLFTGNGNFVYNEIIPNGVRCSAPLSVLYATSSQMQSTVGVVLYIDNVNGIDQYTFPPIDNVHAVKSIACLITWVGRWRWMGHITLQLNFKATNVNYGRISFGWDPNGGAILPQGNYKLSMTADTSNPNLPVLIAQLYCGMSTVQILNGSWVFITHITMQNGMLGINQIPITIGYLVVGSSYFQLFNSTAIINNYIKCMGGSYFVASGTGSTTGTSNFQVTQGDTLSVASWFLPNSTTKVVNKTVRPTNGFLLQIRSVDDSV